MPVRAACAPQRPRHRRDVLVDAPLGHVATGRRQAMLAVRRIVHWSRGSGHGRVGVGARAASGRPSGKDVSCTYAPNGVRASLERVTRWPAARTRRPRTGQVLDRGRAHVRLEVVGGALRALLGGVDVAPEQELVAAGHPDMHAKAARCLVDRDAHRCGGFHASRVPLWVKASLAGSGRRESNPHQWLGRPPLYH